LGLSISKLVLQGIHGGGYLSNTQFETIQGVLPNISFIKWYWIGFFFWYQQVLQT
jgi:hypothetical protein